MDTYVQIITIILAFTGIYLVAKIITMKKRIDYATLRARAFLNESFLMDIWALILLICFLFLIHASGELIEILALLSIEPGIMSLIKEGTELGILICIIILIYKWLKLVNTAKTRP